MKPSSRCVYRIVLAAALSLLSACTVLPPAEPVDVYVLPAPRDLALNAHGAGLPVSLRIAQPASGSRLAGKRIIVMPDDRRMSVYKGANWSDPAPLLLRNRLIDVFRADGRVAALAGHDHALQTDYTIHSDLLAFQSEYRNGYPEVVIRIDACLVQAKGNVIVDSRRFEVSSRPASVELPDVVDSFGDASTRLATALVEWAVQHIGQRQSR